MAEVIIIVPGFCAPRIVRQRCSASMTTAAPSGERPCMSVSAIWLVRRSCICGPAREDVNGARDLADADDAPLRDVADVRLAVEGEEVVLAERVEGDVLEDDHLLVRLLEARRQDSQRVLEEAGEQLGVHLRDALRRAGETFA